MPQESKKNSNKEHKYWKLTVQTSNLDTNRQYKEAELQEDERETQQAYCISPGDMKGTVITGLVLSLMNLQCFRER